MKFIVIRANLKNGVNLVERASGENLNLPVLKNVLIETDENKIKATCTNLEIAASSFISGKVLEKGKFTAPIGLLSGVLNNIQSDRLNIESKGGKLEIKTDNYSASIQGMPADDFPLTPKIKDAEEFLEMKAETLKAALEQVLVAAQFSDLRPELNSILVDFSLDALKLVSTDSFRLAEKTVSSDLHTHNHKEAFRILLPLKTAQELVRVLKDGEILKVYHDENQALFKTEQLELLSRLVEGSFPDYGAIVPKKFAAEITAAREEFIGALKLAGIFGSKSSEVRLKMQEKGKVVEIVSADQALGENNYLLPAKISGKPREIIFNWRYLMDALKVLKSEEVFLGVNGDDEPAEIKSPGDNSYFYILKPIVGS